MKNTDSRQIVSLFIALFLVGSLLTSFDAYPQDRVKLEKQRKKLEQDIEFTKKLLQETNESKQLSLNQLETLKEQIKLRERMLNNISQEISVINEGIDETSAIIDALEKDLEDLKKEYAGMLYDMYKNRSALNQLIFIFNAKSFNDAYMRLRYLQQFGQFRKRQAELIEETRQTLEKKRLEQEQHRAEKQKLYDTEQEQRTKLDEEKKKHNQLITSLQQQEKKLKEDIDLKQQAADNLSKEIQRLIKKEIEAAAAAAKKKAEEEAKAKKTPTTTKSNVLNLTPEAAKLSADFASNQGKLPWPCKGIISTPFGKHKHPVLAHVEVNNNGVDIKTSENEQVRSIFNGTVVTVMYNPGFQRAVLVRHGEYFTVYSNLKEVFVRSGDQITVSQPIGLVYTDDKDGESKMHLEVWKGTTLLNPALWIYPNNQ